LVSAELTSVAGPLHGPIEAISPHTATRRTEIELRDVSVSYSTGKEGSKTVLSKLNLKVAAGEFVVILGETGCGKSTLLRLILGQEFPTEGAIEVDGKPVTSIDARCGYVPQKYSLFPDRSVLGNVMYGPENAKSRFLARLRPSFFAWRRTLRAEAQGYLVRMGLRPQDMNKYPHQLSGGMQQRVAIAQALLMHPPVLLLDEAFSALDPSTRASLQEQLQGVWLESKPTVVFVTHNTSEALLLGTRLILLRRHHEDFAGETNLVLDMEIPKSQLPRSMRMKSIEFQELLEHVKQLAYKSSSMHTDEEADSSVEEGALA
jgi:NitT/TauT family transport system ATP-binding protein